MVRLKRPFYPVAASSRSYDYGIVAEMITAAFPAAETEVLVYLYDLETAALYTDETGQPMYCFYKNELSLVED